jgi:hypothetical protein
MTKKVGIGDPALLTEAQQQSMNQKIDLILSLAGSDPATMMTALSHALVYGAEKCEVAPMNVIGVLAQIFYELQESRNEGGEA